VLKGPRPVQRRNAQFWTDISQDTEKLVTQIHTPEATAQTVETGQAQDTVPTTPETGQAQDTVPTALAHAEEPAQTSVSPAKPDVAVTRVVSPRAQAAKRAARVARKGKIDRPASSGPKPSQRGFKWPASPSES